MTDAASLVFSTPELLELILLNLPHRDLLLSRRISSTFNKLIDFSRPLQQKLFLHPSPDTTLKDWHANPLLRDLFLPFFAAPEDRFNSRDYSVLKALDWAKDEKTRQAIIRKEANWRQMALISHPPHLLRVVKWTHDMDGSSEVMAHVPFDSKKGVTMGAVYDIVHSFVVKNSVCSFGMAFNQVDMPVENQLIENNNPESERQARVEMTLYLDWTWQCCIGGPGYDDAKLRSDGEEVRAQGLEWRTRREWVDEGLEEESYVPGVSDESKSDLDMERGGVDEGEWEQWRSRRGE